VRYGQKVSEPLFQIINYADLTPGERQQIFARAGLDLETAKSQVIDPLAMGFRKSPLATLTDSQLKFDGVVASKLMLDASDLKAAYERMQHKAPEALAAFTSAAKNITAFHELQRQTGFQTEIAGNTLGVKFVPFDRVALYVPGGKALYPSTVLMGVIPAKLAGVGEIVLMSPPPKPSDDAETRVADIVLAVAHIAGVTRVLQAGGAQAIFAAAYGIPELSLKPADFIYGPGNIYVSAAKTYVAGQNLCGIDSFAGPSEVVIIADESANARYVAHDLMAQAEHDENAQAILLTTSQKLANAVGIEIQNSLEKRPDDEKRKQITLASIKRNGKIILVKSLEDAISISNQYAPEHLEIQTERNDQVLAGIRAAGSIFVGDYAPVAAGDYYSGTNHILPTAGAARFNSGVSVYSFYRRITWQKLTEAGLAAGKDAISTMSREEGLFAEHGYSVLTRFED
jgi:histidinol dehydrogenase